MTINLFFFVGYLFGAVNNKWHHFDPLGTARMMTNSSASVISDNLYDVFGVKRYEQGSAQTPWRWKKTPEGEEGAVSIRGRCFLPKVAAVLQTGGTDSQKWHRRLKAESRCP